MKLTKTAIDAMVYEGRSPKAKDLRWDDEVPGFGVRVYPDGGKSFFVIYRHVGRERFMVLGRYGILTLQQARDQAREVKVKALQGKDPLGDRKRRNEGKTFGELAAAYLERHAAKKRSGHDDEAMLRNHVLATWKSLPVASIRPSDVAALHHKISQKRAESGDEPRVGNDWKKGRSSGGPIVANRVVALLSKMFNLATTWDFLPRGAPNPAKGIERNEEPERERFLSPQEVRRLVERIDREDSLYVRKAIWGYILTGTRKMTLLSLEWKHIDFAGGRVIFQRTKKGKPFVMPLTSHLVALFQSIPRISKNPYVFVGRRKGRHLVSIDKNWQTIRADCGLNDVRIHDLRHTVITWLANSGYSFALIGKAVDQSNERTTKRYAHLQLKPAKRVLESHGDQLEAILGAKTDDEIAAIMAGEDEENERPRRRTVSRPKLRRRRPAPGSQVIVEGEVAPAADHGSSGADSPEEGSRSAYSDVDSNAC